MSKEAVHPEPVVRRDRWYAIGSFIVICCILCSLAMVHEKSVFGFSPGEQRKQEKISPIKKLDNGEIINTTELGSKILGYGGTVPIEIFVRDGRIDSIRALPNNETPEVFRRLYEENLMKVWNGHTLKEAASLQVDGVSGATYSSNAVIGNVRAGVDYALGLQSVKPDHPSGFLASISLIAALIVILSGAVIPLFIHGNLRYRLIQQILNVVILGFWAGVFIDYAMMLNFFAHGLSFTLAGVVTIVLLIIGLLYPVFNKPGHYCMWICPFGSLQELAGRIHKRKIRMSPGLLKTLDTFRSILWVVLLSLLFIGYGYQWIDYEIFTGFIVRSASWIVICVGILFVILSVFINRPFCRFVCPTGTLLRNS